MTKSTITRERIQQIFLGNGPELSASEERELARMTLVAMDSEPVAVIDLANLDYLLSGADADVWPPEREEMGDVLLYRHAQPAPVVPDDVLAALQKVARIRLDMDGFDGDRRGIADCLCDAEEALIEVVNRRAAMLNGGKP